MEPIVIERRPVQLAHRVVERAAPVVNGLLLAALGAWLAVVVAAAGALSLLAFAVGAPGWAYLAIAIVGVLLAAPVAGPVVTVLAAVHRGRALLRRAAAVADAVAWETLPPDPRLRP